MLGPRWAGRTGRSGAGGGEASPADTQERTCLRAKGGGDTKLGGTRRDNAALCLLEVLRSANQEQMLKEQLKQQLEKLVLLCGERIS